MPDNIALSADEQKFFDSKGETDVSRETVVEETPKVAEEAVIEKKTEKQVKAKAPVKKSQVQEVENTEEPAETPVKEENSEVTNLKAALKQARIEQRESERRTEERLRQLQSIAEAKKNEAPIEEMPDPDRDALGAVKFLMKKVQTNEQQTIQQQQTHQATQHIISEAGKREMEYLQDLEDFNPTTRTSETYNQASTFLMNMRKNELEAVGYNPQQIAQIIHNEKITLAANVMQNGRNPAETIMAIAKARGFAAKPKVEAETEQQKIARIAKGQEQGFSIGQASGSKAPNNSKLDAKTLATMSDEEFTAFMSKASKSSLRSVFGD